MKSKKQLKPTRNNIARQEKVEKRVKAEKVELGQPLGKERFEQVMKRAVKKKVRRTL